jgi:hypothetical protein
VSGSRSVLRLIPFDVASNVANAAPSGAFWNLRLEKRSPWRTPCLESEKPPAHRRFSTEMRRYTYEGKRTQKDDLDGQESAWQAGKLGKPTPPEEQWPHDAPSPALFRGANASEPPIWRDARREAREEGFRPPARVARGGRGAKRSGLGIRRRRAPRWWPSSLGDRPVEPRATAPWCRFRHGLAAWPQTSLSASARCCGASLR